MDRRDRGDGHPHPGAGRRAGEDRAKAGAVSGEAEGAARMRQLPALRGAKQLQDGGRADQPEGLVPALRPEAEVGSSRRPQKRVDLRHSRLGPEHLRVHHLHAGLRGDVRAVAGK